MLTDFNNSFTIEFRVERRKKQAYNLPPYTTVPHYISKFE